MKSKGCRSLPTTTCNPFFLRWTDLRIPLRDFKKRLHVCPETSARFANASSNLKKLHENFIFFFATRPNKPPDAFVSMV